MFLILIRDITLFENYFWQNFLSFSYSSNWGIALEGERNNGEIHQKLQHNLTYISQYKYICIYIIYTCMYIYYICVYVYILYMYVYYIYICIYLKELRHSADTTAKKRHYKIFSFMKKHKRGLNICASRY